MVEVLERIAEKTGFNAVSEKGRYNEGGKYSNVSKDTSCSTFSEMYLEKPADMGITASISTWRDVPTIDDW
ncbi:MAG: hypothetical protein AAB958_00640 [Patescibacteria group bacterium]